MKTHELKCWPEFFEPVSDGSKTFELRKNDRHFAIGDVLHLREWDDHIESYTGRECRRKITYMLEGVGGGCIPPYLGLMRGYVILSLVNEE